MYEVSNYDARNILVEASGPRVVQRVRRAERQHAHKKNALFHFE
jgi:hypothetical protein